MSGRSPLPIWTRRFIDRVTTSSVGATFEKALAAVTDVADLEIGVADRLAEVEIGFVESSLEPFEKRVRRMRTTQVIFEKGYWLTGE